MDWKDALEQLVKFIEEAAPTIWMLARRQVLVVILQNTIGVVVCSVLTVLGYKCTKVFHLKHQEDPRGLHDISAGMCIAVAVACGVAILLLTGSIIGRVINPDYYAIWYLVQFVK